MGAIVIIAIILWIAPILFRKFCGRVAYLGFQLVTLLPVKPIMRVTAGNGGLYLLVESIVRLGLLQIG